jgi:hypothetical protein
MAIGARDVDDLDETIEALTDPIDPPADTSLSTAVEVRSTDL